MTSRNGAVVRWSERLTRPEAQACLLLAFLVFVGCASPTPRLDGFLGSRFSGQAGVESGRAEGLPQPLVAVLVVACDVPAPGSDAGLSEEGRASLVRRVKESVERTTPVRISAGDSQTIRPEDLARRITDLAREQGVGYMLVVLVSGAESEAPATLSLGGPESTPVPGVEIQHHALTELALLDVARNRLLTRVSGRAWAVLEELALSIHSHHYPLIRRSNGLVWLLPGVPAVRDLVRVVAAEESVDQAVFLLASGWGHATAR